MRKLSVAILPVLLGLLVAPLAQATKVPTVPTITGAVFTTVNLHDPNYANECNNGNPAVNCNQYTAKQYVFLNGGPAKNQLSPDGVYFYAVLAPSGQANPNDGTPENLSDDYDCYKNREIVISGGEVSSILSSNDNGCFASGTPFAHQFASPYVGLYPYADTPNPGGVYIMAVCYVGPVGTTTLSAPVTPSLCKYDAFKVLVDKAPPVCKLVSKSGATISVSVQDAGAGLEDVDVTSTNANVSFPEPLIVGQTTLFYVNATKIDSTHGATLHLVVTDPAGNQTVCDPVYGLPKQTLSTSVGAGNRAMIMGVRASQSHLSLSRTSNGLRRAVVSVNGKPFALVSLTGRATKLDLTSALSAHRKNTITVSAIGARGRLLVRISR
jgi:hypothetical protein